MRLQFLPILITVLLLWGGSALGQGVQAAFNVSSTIGCTPITVTFTDQSTGSPTSWFWTFGDGTSSTVQNPSHTYQQSGWYFISLSVSDGVNFDSTTTWLNFNAPQVFAINTPPTLSCGPGLLEFTAQVDSFSNGFNWEWNITGPASYTSNDSAALINIASPGTYQVEVIVSQSSGTGCSDTLTSTLVVPVGMISALSVVDETCSSANGSATVSTSGGTAPYNFQWSNGVTTATISNLSAGSYVVTVVDAIGCITLDTAIVDNIGLDVATTIVEPSCDNTSDGSIAVDIISGQAPFSYLWNTGATTDSIGGLVSGIYTVTVTDDLGCTTTEDFILNSTTLDLVITTTDANCNGANGTATVEVLGGTAPYTFSWTNGATDSINHNMSVGGYAVYVTDYTGCQDHEVLYIEYADSCTIEISGRMYYDSNADCVFDPVIDTPVPGWVTLSNGQAMIAGVDGLYSFTVFPGTYSVGYNSSYYSFLTPLCPSNGIHLLTNQDTDATNLDFAFDSDSVFQDLRVQMYKTNIRPGFSHWYYVSVYNDGPLPADGILTLTFDTLVSISNFSVIPTTYNPANHTASWVLPTLNSTSSFHLNITASIGQTVPIGTLITTTAQVDPLASDITPVNNVLTCYRNVTASYDPNDKLVTPQGDGPEGFIEQSDTDMLYTIRFQNTGNDTAFVVVVQDEIEADLDIMSFQPATSSHPYELTIKDGNTLVFTFDNILLVDSTTNEPASHGHVSFKMKHNGTLPFGTEITNTAAIYFDFNAPIITNTALNTIASPNALQEDLSQFVKVFPNPSQGNLVIQYESLNVESLAVYNLQGKLVQSQTNMYPGQIQISLNDHVAGTYLLQLNTDRGSITHKITLMK